jgi:hypothetical protein
VNGDTGGEASWQAAAGSEREAKGSGVSIGRLGKDGRRAAGSRKGEWETG